MQLSNIPAKLPLPFAATGDRNAIPVTSQIATTPGAASFEDGFPPLTRTPLVAGGVPPFGQDMNGILYELSVLIRWVTAGGGFPYDATFAADGNVDGYPKGARLMRSDGMGYWLNTADNNSVDPESATVGEAVAAGWVPDYTNGVAAVAMAAANVTLDPSQYGKPVIVLSGVLAANLNLIFPDIAGQWTVVNNCTGPYSVTCKTAAGGGVPVQAGSTRIVFGDSVGIYPAAKDEKKIGIISYSVDTNLSTANIGQTITTGANGVTLTLPPLASVQSGSVFAFISGFSSMIVSTQGGDIFNDANSIQQFGAADTLTIVAGANAWWLMSGSVALKSSSTFGHSLVANGYQKLPGGFILQQGSWLANATPGSPVAVTFPISFPTACLQVLTGANRSATDITSSWHDTPTQTGFNGHSNIASIGCPFIAIGF